MLSNFAGFAKHHFFARRRRLPLADAEVTWKFCHVAASRAGGDLKALLTPVYEGNSQAKEAKTTQQ